MLTSAAAELVAGSGVALPQGLVGLAVDTFDVLPFLDDGPHPVTGGLPLRVTGSELLGLGNQSFLGRHRTRAGFVAGQELLGQLGLGRDPQLGQRRGQRGQVTDDRGVGEGVLHGGRLVPGGFGLAGARIQAPPQQVDLGGQVGVAALVERHTFRGVAGLPRADRPFAVGGPYEDGSVVVDPPPFRRHSR